MPKLCQLQLLFRKILLNVELDIRWMLFAPVSLPLKARFFFDKYAAILTNARSIPFLKNTIEYDNRLTPALLTEYVFEIEHLNSVIHLSKISSILDIGANIGQFAYTSKALFPHLKIHSLEPNPAIYPLLVANRSRFTNWTSSDVGVGSESKKVPFFFVPGKSGQGSLFLENSSQGLLSSAASKTFVEIVKIDEIFFKRFGLERYYDLIKIDVEGAEREVLQEVTMLGWKYLKVELSEGRAGSLGFTECISILNTKIKNIRTLYQSVPTGESKTFEVILENLDVSTHVNA